MPSVAAERADGVAAYPFGATRTPPNWLAGARMQAADGRARAPYYRSMGRQYRAFIVLSPPSQRAEAGSVCTFARRPLPT